MLTFAKKHENMALQIKEVLKTKGISVQELADRMGINRVSLSYQINGNPTLETLIKIASNIGVDVSELFEPSQKGGLIGVVRYNNVSYEINSISDIEKLLEEIKGK